MTEITTDICVIGGGHAGCEAALASARLGFKTILFCINIDSIAMMPCNPNIGGTSKGHLVREVDALGGEMGKNIDKSFIQSRMLNMSKGPAVQSLRAQADKRVYTDCMKSVIEHTENLTIRQQEIVSINVENGSVVSVTTEYGSVINTRAAIICAGTYLNSRCLVGENITECGPNGYRASTKLTSCLKGLGIEIQRFKTGTPARIDVRSIDFTKMSEQEGDDKIVPFSFANENNNLSRPQISCWLSYTNKNTHDIIRASLHRSPMYSGLIEGTGTRYCPSIEDKIVRFSDKDRHQVFIEPEGERSNEMYVAGMSTSLPEDVQLDMYRSVPGLENCEITRNGYAIEYDCIVSTQLKPSLEFKEISGLFSAGQLNGSSGYEEAACQGLIAGINAARLLSDKPPLTLDRSEAYIGVLIDDLVTKGTNEPYRMMTSRSEYRLLLRQDNADLRLSDFGHEIGLLPDESYEAFCLKRQHVFNEIKRVLAITIAPSVQANELLQSFDSTEITNGVRLSDLIKRPELSYQSLEAIDFARPKLTEAEASQVNIQIKYEGYIKRQQQQIDQFKKLEKKQLPKVIDYNGIKGLSIEARQKLDKIKPESIGQASRISGVTPADVSVLLVYLEIVK